MYKTLIWSALEVGSICYSHADNTSVFKLQSFQESTLRQLGLTGFAIDSMATRRKVAHTSMLYKQVVLGEGPDFIRTNFPVKAPGPRAHLSRPATERHIYQLSIPHRLRAGRISKYANILSVPSLSGTLSGRAPWPESPVSTSSSGGLRYIPQHTHNMTQYTLYKNPKTKQNIMFF